MVTDDRRSGTNRQIVSAIAMMSGVFVSVIFALFVLWLVLFACLVAVRRVDFGR